MVSRFANSHQIRISKAAAKDILEIYDYVVEFDSEPAESEPEDKGHAKKIRFLTDAWIDSGKPMERGKPYVSRPALKQAIEDNGYSSVRNQTMLFTAMAKSGQLEVFKDGWIVVDDKFYSQMMVLR